MTRALGSEQEQSEQKQTALLTCCVLVSKDTAGFRVILASHEADISARRERKAGRQAVGRRDSMEGRRRYETERDGERLTE